VKKRFAIGLIILIIVLLSILLYRCEFPLGPGTADYSYDMVKNYAIYKVGNNERSIDIRTGSSYEYVIKGYITKVAWDDDFIIAEENYENYWIIEVETDKVYGPYTKEQFDEQKIKLKVNENLEMKDPDYFKDKK